MKKLNNIIIFVIAGLTVVIAVLAFTGPGTRTPGTDNPDFWIKNANDVYYNPAGGGNVGIGTNGPTYKLDVRGGRINTSDGLCIAGNCKTDWGQITGSSYWIQSTSNLYASSTSWNVGIGTASPDANYKITTSDGGIKAENITAQPAGYFSSTGGGPAVMAGTGGISLGGVTKTSWPSGGQWIDGVGGIIYYNGGNVGIGTIIPGTKLEVAGQIKITGGSPGLNKILTSDASGLATWQTPASGLPSGTSGQTLRHDGTNWVANSIIYNNGTNVGIGTTGPTAKLQVDGTIYSNNTGANEFALNSGGANYGFISNQATGVWSLGYGTAIGTLATPVLNWNSSGNVGIGTTGPSSKLTVTGDIQITDYVNNRIISNRFANGSGSYPLSIEATNNDLTLGAGSGSPTERMRITTTGNVGIGTTSPQQKLHVVGTNSLDGTGVIVGANTGTTGNAVGITGLVGSSLIQVGTGGPTGILGVSDLANGKGVYGYATDASGYAGYFYGRGYFSDNVGIGTTSPGAKLEVAGQVKITGGSPGLNKVLTSDVNGLASWQTSAGGAIAGEIKIWSTSVAPIGYLLCDGSAVSRITYANLFAVIGATYGVGDGSTTFNLPNLKGNVPVGYDAAQSEFNTLGKVGGEKTHTLTINEMPAHTHDLLSGGYPTAGIFTKAQDQNQRTNTTAAAGGGQPHNNLQPYITLTYIIKF